MRKLLALVSFAVLAGCHSFDVQQTCRFVSDEGKFAEVDYCKGRDEYTTTFYVAKTGKTLEFKSKLRVKVRSDVADFKAYQCMNFFQNGTLYESSDREWLFHADGFTCAIWQQFDDPNNKGPRPSYKRVFAGVLSQAPRGTER